MSQGNVSICINTSWLVHELVPEVFAGIYDLQPSLRQPVKALLFLLYMIPVFRHQLHFICLLRTWNCRLTFLPLLFSCYRHRPDVNGDHVKLPPKLSIVDKWMRFWTNKLALVGCPYWADSCEYFRLLTKNLVVNQILPTGTFLLV